MRVMDGGAWCDVVEIDLVGVAADIELPFFAVSVPIKSASAWCPMKCGADRVRVMFLSVSHGHKVQTIGLFGAEL